MKVKNKHNGAVGFSVEFNTHGMSEIIVGFIEGDCSSEYIRDYDVYLDSTGTWKDMNQAFKDRDIIPNNYNTGFREAESELEMMKGYF